MDDCESYDVSPLPLSVIAQQLGLDAQSIEPRGWFTGKIPSQLHEQLTDRPRGHYIGVTAINPTPLGEGKTVIAIGLAMGLTQRGKRSIVTLRQPSLAPVFGIKGGGAGGGRSRVLPSDEINLHLTGDLHAVAAANNLLAAMVDNHAQRGLTPLLDIGSITWRRALDISDKGLAHIESGLDHVPMAPQRHTGFDLTAASEVMSVLALSTSLADLRQRLGRMVVGQTSASEYVTAEEIGATGAMTALLQGALCPNLVQTAEHSPAIVHAGPFANISHGNSSVIGDLTALRLADYVVTESGFGSDLGAEKFFDIKCRTPGLRPSVEVLVCTVRAIKYHSGRFTVRPGRPLPEALLLEDCDALRAGISNLTGHLANLRQFGIPVVVAINRFPTDTENELKLLRSEALEAGALTVVPTDVFRRGGSGAVELADAVIDACSLPNNFRPLYPLDISYEEKVKQIATCVYGAEGVDFHPGVIEQLQDITQRGYGGLPVCVAKTQYSLSHDPQLLGRPQGFRLPIRAVRLSAGAGFVLVMTEGISLMPGLPRDPAARRIDVMSDGRITGLGD